MVTVDCKRHTASSSVVAPGSLEDIRKHEGRPEYPRRGLRPISAVVEELKREYGLLTGDELHYRRKLDDEISRRTGE